MSKIAKEIKEAQSNDPFTCRLSGGISGISIDPRGWGGAGASSSLHAPLRLAGSGEMLVCLDIAAASLPGVEPLVNYAPAPADGAAAASRNNASIAFGGGVTCDGNAHGDGTLNVYDVTAFLWASFGKAPGGARLPNGTELAAVETVIPRTGTTNGCTSAFGPALSVASNKTGWVAVAGDVVAGGDAGADATGTSAPQLLTRAEYQLMLASDYCATEIGHSRSRRLETRDATAAEAGTWAAAPAGVTTARALQRQLAHDPEGEAAEVKRYQDDLAAALLSCADTACIRDALVRSLPPQPPPSPPRSANVAMGAPRLWELVSTQEEILVQRWAAVEGLGQWYRLILPRTALVAEIYLLNAPPLSGQLDPGQPPEAGCAANECAPLEAKRGTVLVGFHRRLDLLEAAGRVDANGVADARGCASIDTVSHLVADTISVQQNPPNAACPFDLFVWVPESLEPTRRLQAYGAGQECGGVFGVATGSTINDGRTGVVLWSDACAPPPPSPPSPQAPPSPAPLPSPPSSPPPSSSPPLSSKAGGRLDELAFDDVPGWGGLTLLLLALLLCCCCLCAALLCCRRRRQQEALKNSKVALGVSSAEDSQPPAMSWLSSRLSSFNLWDSHRTSIPPSTEFRNSEHQVSAEI